MKKSFFSNLFKRCDTRSNLVVTSKEIKLNRRRLCIENLESRELLSVSYQDYERISSQYEDLNLPVSFESTAFLEVSDLTVTNLQEAIHQAEQSESDCVILLRPTESSNQVLSMNGKTLTINA